MRVLLLGGSGLLSGATLEAFLAAGHDVTVVSRGQRALPQSPRLTSLRAERRDSASLTAALGRSRYDFTADFLAFEAGDMARLLSVPGFFPGRLVALSSGQVYLVTAAPRPPFREADAGLPLMEEPAVGTRDHREWEYGVGKRAVEAELAMFQSHARGVPALALRLPVVQGEADRMHSRRLWAWIERLRDGGPVLLPEGGSQPVRFVYAGDAAAALLALAERSDWPAVPALNLAQPDECSLLDFLQQVATLAGARAHFVPVAADVLARSGLADTCAPYWGRWCSRPDASLALEQLGLRTRTVAEYLPPVVHAHLQPSSAGSHPGYARRAEELALAAKLTGR